MSKSAEYYKDELEDLLIRASNDGYGLHVETEVYADGCCKAEVDFQGSSLTFSNQDSYKKNGVEFEYASTNEDLHISERV